MTAPSIIATLTEAQTVLFVLAVMLLLVAALAGAKMANWLGIPKVAGEILGGLLLGPTLLGAVFPETYDIVFRSFEGQGQAISVFYWLGLILLMFTSGYEIDISDFRSDRKVIGWLLAGSTVPPFVLGYLVSAIWFVDIYIGRADNAAAFNLVFAIAVAVTSIPVISKIFLDLGLIKHRFARIVLVTATIQDLFLWIILSLATGLTLNSDITFFGLLGHVAVTVLMFVFAMFLAPALTRWPRLKQLAIFSYDSIYFVLCFLCICIGGLFGISIIYSAFVAGLMFRKIKNPEAVRAQAKIRDLSLAFFTPVYFAIVGLRIHLTGDFDFGMFLMILLIISVIELAGCLAAMRAIKMDWLSSLNLGVAMNARGGPGIVLATVTYELGIINYDFFCVLILATLVTSTLAGWWIAYVNRQGKLLSNERLI